jgi:vitamin B12 transporter
VKGRRSIYGFRYIPSGAIPLLLSVISMRLKQDHLIQNHHNRGLFLLILFVLTSSGVFAQSRSDSSKLLRNVTVTAGKLKSPYAAVIPVQRLNREALQLINAESIGDAAKYFSGVLIKDYGGVGGLKTISVRSLGGLNTGLLYDGMMVADAQTGQIDLSKFSATFVQSLELDLSNPQEIPLPARVYSSASILSLTSNTFNTANFTQAKWVAGIDAGSFGLWQPYAGLYLPAGKNMVVSANAEATWAGGHYPYDIKNGSFSQKAERTNSDIHSLQGEINGTKQFNDSSTLSAKVWYYGSDRGLPGSIIFFNDISVQRLADKDVFIQSQYRRKLGSSNTLLISAKYSSYYTRYTDPNFLNNNGGLDDRYTQNEFYGSAALSHRVGKYFIFSLSSDAASTHLSANIPSFPTPTRTSLWNSFAAQFAKTHWQINGSLLNTNITDRTVIGTAATNKNKFTPSVAVGYKTSPGSPFLFRVFYKDIFRMPTFNDLYYTYISNINPKLLPEYSNQYNAGITYSKSFGGAVKQMNISVDGYYNTIKDKIIGVPSQNLFVWTMENIGKVQIKGVDLNADINGKFSRVTRWSARIAYTWQQALDVTDPTSSEYKNEIPYTPQHSGSALLAVYYKSWSAGYSFIFSGTRYTLGENDPTNRLTGWSTSDLLLTKQVGFHHFQTILKGEVNNAFDERYDVVHYYPMPGRSYKLSIIFKNL